MDADELEAAELVASRLGGAATALDVEGAPDKTCDFEIVLANGARVALEVTSTKDTAVLSLMATSFGRQHKARGLANDWQVGIPHPSASAVPVSNLVKKIVPLLAVFEANGISEAGSAGRPGPAPAGSPAEVRDAYRSMLELGAILVRSFGPVSSEPQLFITVHGGVGADIDEVNQLVVEAAEANAEKLAGTVSDERHLFVWLDSSRPAAELAVFTGTPPAMPPSLPPAVDAVWLATKAMLAPGKVGVQRLWRVRPLEAWESLAP
jgi:hypothetical protein